MLTLFSISSKYFFAQVFLIRLEILLNRKIRGQIKQNTRKLIFFSLFIVLSNIANQAWRILPKSILAVPFVCYEFSFVYCSFFFSSAFVLSRLWKFPYVLDSFRGVKEKIHTLAFRRTENRLLFEVDKLSLMKKTFSLIISF